MKTRVGMQEILIRSESIEDAVAEQLKSLAADEGLENGRRGTVATPQQKVGSRRRMDAIVNELIDCWTDSKVLSQKTMNLRQLQNAMGISSRRRTHRGRRSAESVARRANRK